LKIRIYYDQTNYRFPGWRKAVQLIDKVIRNEGFISGDLNFIISTDSIVKEINEEFLNHNYYTDVISFEYNSGNVVNGEIYISKDTVKENSYNYKVSLNEEILRVMIHGILHLCGYKDGNNRQRLLMRKKENVWLKEFFGKHYGIQI
jgi:probable rRNA maturation factor